jgi:hypothetical protein
MRAASSSIHKGATACTLGCNERKSVPGNCRNPLHPRPLICPPRTQLSTDLLLLLRALESRRHRSGDDEVRSHPSAIARANSQRNDNKNTNEEFRKNKLLVLVLQTLKKFLFFFLFFFSSFLLYFSLFFLFFTKI